MSSNRSSASASSSTEKTKSPVSSSYLSSFDASDSSPVSDDFSLRFPIGKDKKNTLEYLSPNQWLLNGKTLSNSELDPAAALALYQDLEKTALENVLLERLPTVFKGKSFLLNESEKQQETALMRQAGFEVKALNKDDKVSAVSIQFNKMSSSHFLTLYNNVDKKNAKKRRWYLWLAAINTSGDPSDRAKAFLGLSNAYSKKNPMLSRVCAFQAVNFSDAVFPAPPSESDTDARPNALADFIRTHFSLIKKLNHNDTLLQSVIALGAEATFTDIHMLLNKLFLSYYLPQNQTVPTTLIPENPGIFASEGALNYANQFVSTGQSTRKTCTELLTQIAMLDPHMQAALQPYLEPYYKLANQPDFFNNISFKDGITETALANQFNQFYHSSTFQDALTAMQLIKLNFERLTKVITEFDKKPLTEQTKATLSKLTSMSLTPVQRPTHFEGLLNDLQKKITEPNATATFKTLIENIVRFNRYSNDTSNVLSLLSDYADPLRAANQVFAANQQSLVMFQASLTAAEHAKADLIQTKQKAEKDIQNLEEKAATLSSKVSSLTHENTALESKATALTAELEKAKTSVTTLTQELKKMDEIGRGLSEENNSLSQEKERLALASKTFDATIATLNTKLAEANQIRAHQAEPQSVAARAPEQQMVASSSMQNELERLQRENNALKAAAQTPQPTSWWKKAASAIAGAALATVGVLSIIGKISLVAVVAATAVTPVGWALVGIGALALIGAGAAQAYDSYQAHKKATQVNDLSERLTDSPALDEILAESPSHDEIMNEPIASSHARMAANGLLSQRSAAPANPRPVSIAHFTHPIAGNTARQDQALDAPADESKASPKPSSPK